MHNLPDNTRFKESCGVPEDKAELELAAGKDAPNLEERLLQANDSDKLRFEMERLEALKKKDTYLREKRIADYKADLQEQTAKYLAFLYKFMVISGVIVACLCFLAAIVSRIICWFFPALFPGEAITAINYIVTFGFGVITTQIISKLLVRPV